MEQIFSYFDDQQYTFILIEDNFFNTLADSEILRKSWKARQYQKPQETVNDLAWFGYYRSSKKLIKVLAENFGSLYRYLELNSSKFILYGQKNYLISFVKCTKNICLWKAVIADDMENIPYEALSASAVLENSLKVPLVNEEEKERIKESIKVDRNDISTIETLVINRIGFSHTDDITVLVFEKYDVEDIQDDKVPEAIQLLLIRRGTWLGFNRRKGLLEDYDMYFIGESFNPETLAYNLDQYLDNENLDITVKSNKIIVRGLTKNDQYQKIEIFSPRYIEGKWLWSVRYL